MKAVKLATSLLEQLEHHHITPQPEDMLDALWLVSLNIPAAARPIPSQPEIEKSKPKPEIPPERPQDNTHKKEDKLDTQNKGTENPHEPTTSTAEQPQNNKNGDKHAQLVPKKPQDKDSVAFPVARAKVIRNARALAKALRPFKRSVPSRQFRQLNEAATVDFIAQTNIWLPITEAAPERWLSLALVVDTSPSMIVWKQLIHEFEQLLTRQGIFRTVTTWGLELNEKEKGKDAFLLMHYRSRQQVDKKALLDTTGRQQLIIVISDGHHPAWQGQDISHFLALWGNKNLVSLLHVFPESLWNRTAFDTLMPKTRVTAFGQNKRNRDLISIHTQEKAQKHFFLPTFTLNEDFVKAWARMVVSNGAANSFAFALRTSKPHISPELLEQIKGLSLTTTEPRTPQQEVAYFRERNSRSAYELAGYLAAAPLQLPIMQLVQQVMMPESSSHLHLAEVLTSNLLKPETQIFDFDTVPNFYDADTDAICFDFKDGVREYLLEDALLPDVLEVYKQVSRYIEQHYGKGLNFEAFLTNPTQKGLENQLVEIQPYVYFASVTASVLKRLGGRYAKFADKVSHYIYEGGDKATVHDISAALPVFELKNVVGSFVEAHAFQGFKNELRALKRFFIDNHHIILVQIYAPVGYGKSALAYHFVKQIETSYRDSFTGIVVMSLREATADSFESSFFALLRQVIPTEKVNPFNAILQQSKQEGSSKVVQIVQRILADERILVVLDNVEDALDESNHIRSQYRVVLEMLKHSLASQRVHFLLTSRRPLETSIANLANYSRDIELDGLQHQESINLIYALQGKNDDFKLESVNNLSDILNQDLQGLPLFIEYLVSELRVKKWTLPRYLEKPELLAALKDKVSKVLYESRNAEEQRIMQVLAIFQQPVPLQALEYLLPEIAELSELCDRLEQHLVVLVAKDELGIPSSYALRPVDGEYVLRQVENAKALHLQAANYYVQHASEIQDMLDAFNQMMQAEEYEQAVHILTSVDDELELSGESRRRLELWQQLEDKPLSQESKSNHLYNGLATSYYLLGEVRKAIKYYKQALTIAREMGYRRDEGNYLGNLGLVYVALGEVKQAIDYHRQALKILQEMGDRQGEGTALGNLGLVYVALGEVKQAIDYYHQALKILQEIGDRRGERNRLGNLGTAYRNLGKAQQAIAYYHQALTISQEIGDRRGEGNHLGNLGNAYADLGEVQQAIDYQYQALTISQEIGDVRGEGGILGNLGTVYRNLGEVQQAINYYQQALKIFEEMGDRRGEGNCLGNLGVVAESQQDMWQVFTLWFVALTIYIQIQSPTARTIFQWLQQFQSHVQGTDASVILRDLFAQNGAVGDRILKEATGIDYRFYRKTSYSYVEKIITLLKNGN